MPGVTLSAGRRSAALRSFGWRRLTAAPGGPRRRSQGPGRGVQLPRPFPGSFQIAAYRQAWTHGRRPQCTRFATMPTTRLVALIARGGPRRRGRRGHRRLGRRGVGAAAGAAGAGPARGPRRAGGSGRHRPHRLHEPPRRRLEPARGDPILSGAAGRLWADGNGQLRLELQSDRGDAQVLLDGRTLGLRRRELDGVPRRPARDGVRRERAESGIPSVAPLIQRALTRLMGRRGRLGRGARHGRGAARVHGERRAEARRLQT